MEEHIEWMKDVNRCIENAYKILCHYEEQCNGKLDDEEELKIMRLLETVSDIHTAAQSMRMVKDDLTKKDCSMQTQLQLLEHSLELLDLETKTKSIELQQHNDG